MITVLEKGVHEDLGRDGQVSQEGLIGVEGVFLVENLFDGRDRVDLVVPQALSRFAEEKELELEMTKNKLAPNSHD